MEVKVKKNVLLPGLGNGVMELPFTKAEKLSRTKKEYLESTERQNKTFHL